MESDSLHLNSLCHKDDDEDEDDDDDIPQIKVDTLVSDIED